MITTAHSRANSWSDSIVEQTAGLMSATNMTFLANVPLSAVGDDHSMIPGAWSIRLTRTAVIRLPRMKAALLTLAWGKRLNIVRMAIKLKVTTAVKISCSEVLNQSMNLTYLLAPIFAGTAPTSCGFVMPRKPTAISSHITIEAD
ncbi:hypothetical protein FRB94_012866 [Tulasnella sp. JGI-2019a]|nr:hypothetical protein FRB94_012866 [Tulasnella sp. JGI-2019a]